MSKATSIDNTAHQVWTYSKAEIEFLSDRLYSAGISSLSTLTPKERRDCIAASRILVRLMQKYERATGRTIHALMLGGSCS